MRPDLLIPLVAGHLMGDFVLQTDEMVRNKRNLRFLVSHCAIVAITSWALAGQFRTWWWIVPVLFTTHFLIDLGKGAAEKGLASRTAPSGRPPDWMEPNGPIALYALDQAAHAAVIVLLAWGASASPGLQATLTGQGLWVELLGTAYLRCLVLVSGWLLVALASGHLIGLVLGRFEDELSDAQKDGLAKGGFWIGVTERSVIYLFILVGEPAGIGFLAAAKSVFRIGELKEAGDRKLAEYILIGTLTSFAVAMVIGLLVREALGELP